VGFLWELSLASEVKLAQARYKTADRQTALLYQLEIADISDFRTLALFSNRELYRFEILLEFAYLQKLPGPVRIRRMLQGLEESWLGG
jgi:hypothetical protein